MTCEKTALNNNNGNNETVWVYKQFKFIWKYEQIEKIVESKKN